MIVPIRRGAQPVSDALKVTICRLRGDARQGPAAEFAILEVADLFRAPMEFLAELRMREGDQCFGAFRRREIAKIYHPYSVTMYSTSERGSVAGPSICGTMRETVPCAAVE